MAQVLAKEVNVHGKVRDCTIERLGVVVLPGHEKVAIEVVVTSQPLIEVVN